MNVFDRTDGPFSVVVNDDDQHSLWPGGLQVPSGWRVVHGEDSREGCLAYVDEHWRDQRPRGARRPAGPGRPPT